MNWISRFLKKPAAKPAVPPLAPAAKPVGEDVAQLRGSLAGAVDGEQAQLAARLGRALAAWSLAPQAADPPATWVAAICHASDKSQALAWLASLQDDAWLAEVAKQAHSGEIRYAAVQRIEASAILEQVAEVSRDKDKRVYRHCADLLKQRRETQAQQQHAQRFADGLRALLASAPLQQTRLLELKKELAGLAGSGPLRAECDALMEQAFARLRQEAQERRELQVRLEQAAQLATECAQAAWPWSEQLAGWRERLAQLAATSIPADDATLSGIATRLDALAQDDDRVLACEQFLATLAGDVPPDAEQCAAWNALAKPAQADALRPLQARWQALRKCAPPPPPVSEPVAPAPVVETVARPQPKFDLAAMRALLDQLEQAVEEGHLAAADTAEKRIKTLLGGQAPHGALESRLHGLHARLEEMRGWARWGTVQVREQLIAAAQALRDAEPDVEELSRAIPKLREEWKRLNATGPAAKGQWESFDSALEQAYQPVAIFRAEQAATQAEAIAAKETLLREWEAEVAAIAWEYADFKVVEARRGQLIKQWREAPQAGFRDEQTLRKRFDPMIAEIDRHLDEARAGEVKRREEIIATAVALHAHADLRQAMAEAKALQERWNQQTQPVRLKRGDEQQLWQRFRAACDAVFARNAAVRAEQAEQRQVQAQARQGLLDEFAASLASSDGADLKRALAKFRGDWENSAPSAAKTAESPARGARPAGRPGNRPAPREAGDGLDARAEALQQQAQRRLDELQREKYRTQLEALAQKSALAEQIEAAALAGTASEAAIAQAQQAWDALPALPGKSETLLARRFTAASLANREELEAGRGERESLLLDLEILLGLPSPEQYAATRNARQLERLQSRFGAAPARQSEPEQMLARWHATAALPDPAFAARIAAVADHLAQQANLQHE